jgi:3-hydroxyisobutyrate dehydrogenase-like beta-hydroxyacid dehydrogenase
MTERKLSFVGPGQMGEPMVERLIAEGWSVSTFTRREELSRTLQAAGAICHESLAEAVAGHGLVIVCVFSEEQLTAVVDGDGTFPGLVNVLEAGATVVSHVTASVAGLIALSSRLSEVGVRLIDAPVSGTAAMIRNGELTVLLGGDDSVSADRAALAVSAYANPVLRTGGVGSATAIKLLNNALFAAHAQIAEEAVALARSQGLDVEATVAALTRCSGTSGAIAYLSSHSTDTLALTEKYLLKDVRALRADLADRGLDLGLLGTVIDGGPLQIS